MSTVAGRTNSMGFRKRKARKQSQEEMRYCVSRDVDDVDSKNGSIAITRPRRRR
jgi:hypothetical protein